MEPNYQDWLEVLLQKNYEQNSIAKILSIDTKPATKKGDNYMSEIKRVKMDLILKSGKKIKKSVIVKGLPPTEYHQNILRDMSIFIREITMYRDVIPNMEDVLKEFGDYTEPMWPQMIDYRPNDLIVLNDLAELGYVMGNRKEGFDLEHSLLIMRSLAKFHATSIIVKERGLITMDIYEKHIFKIGDTHEMLCEYYIEALSKLIKTIETNWEPEWQPIAEKLKLNILPKVLHLVLDKLVYNKNTFSAMNHGDCWVNNILFKYGLDSARPISVKFVDLQISFYCSPVYDLQYFLSSSLNLKVMQNSLDHLIEVYHDSLVKQLQLYSYKGDIITYQQLIDDFNDKNLFGITTAIQLLPFVYRNENDESFPEIEDMFKDMKNKEKATIPDCESPLYHAMIKELLRRADKVNSFSG